jgi:hypothetical protein
MQLKVTSTGFRNRQLDFEPERRTVQPNPDLQGCPYLIQTRDHRVPAQHYNLQESGQL